MPYRISEITGTTRSVAVGHDAVAVLANNAEPDVFGGLQDGAVCHHTFQRCSQRDNRCDVSAALARHGVRHNPAQAVAYQVNPAARLLQGGVDRLVQLPLNKKVRAVCVEPDAGIERLITNSFQPMPQGNQVRVRTKESWYDDDPGSIPMRDAKSVVNR